MATLRDFLKAIQPRPGGSEKIRLVFRWNDEGEAAYLLGLFKLQMIHMYDSDIGKLREVSDSGRWDSAFNRSVTITPTWRFNERSFWDRLGGVIETIEPVGK